MEGTARNELRCKSVNTLYFLKYVYVEHTLEWKLVLVDPTH